MLLKLQIDQTTFQRLNERAASELRPLSLQALVEIRRGLGMFGQPDDLPNVTLFTRQPDGSA